MRANRIQPMRVRMPDGSEREVCCGPAVPTSAVGYRPVGAAHRGTCCHTPMSDATWARGSVTR